MSTQSEQDKNGTGFGPWWVAAGVVVLLVAAGLVWVLLKGGSHTTPRAATPTTPRPNTSTAPSPSTNPSSSSTTTTAPGAAWADRGCNGTAGSSSPPQVAMRDVVWRPFLTVAVPTSATLGPRRIDAPLRRCFQHSPSGALLAAVNITYAASSDPADYRKVLSAQMTPGPGRDKMLASFGGGDPGNLAAFRLDGCTPSVCNVELIAFGHGVYATQTFPVVWTRGDWSVDGSRVIPDAGLVQAIPAGFTAWGPTS